MKEDDLAKEDIYKFHMLTCGVEWTDWGESVCRLLRSELGLVNPVLHYGPDERQSNFKQGFAASDSVGCTTYRLTALLAFRVKSCSNEKSLKTFELQVSLYRISGHGRSPGLSRTMQIFYAITLPYSETRKGESIYIIISYFSIFLLP
jgi:hypothetical protein